MDSVSVCTYGKMKRRLGGILQKMPMRNPCEGMLNGRKIVCFYENIMGEDTCTIDGHARDIAYNERVNLTDKQTNIGPKSTPICKGISLLRVTLSMAASSKAYELQAVTWVTWRKQHGIA